MTTPHPATPPNLVEALQARPRADQEKAALLMAEIAKRRTRRKFFQLFPDEDTPQPDGTVIHAAKRYPKHMEFFAAGSEFRERCFLAANRVGKTVAGAYEITAHLTGQYPSWWTGRRFGAPVRAWAAGKTNETTRDIVQTTLCGEVAFESGKKTFSGTGLIPGEAMGAVTWKQGISDLADTIKVKHVTGGWSTLGLKSYQQGRGSFEGTAQHAIWADEEPPMDVYGECLIRTATTRGLIMITFTPLEGLSEVVLQFMSSELRPGD